MNKIRIENKDLFKVEVNDKGEYIEFDLADINLPFKAKKSFDMINNYMKELKEKEVDLSNLDEGILFEQEMFQKMRAALDNFIGEGGSQKIFGDKNYYGMFEDLLYAFEEPQEELGGQSVMDKLNFTAKGIQDRVIAKYSKKNSDVL